MSKRDRKQIREHGCVKKREVIFMRKLSRLHILMQL